MRKNRQKYIRAKTVCFLITLMATLMLLIPNNSIDSSATPTQYQFEVRNPSAWGSVAGQWGQGSAPQDEDHIRISGDVTRTDIVETGNPNYHYLASWDFTDPHRGSLDLQNESRNQRPLNHSDENYNIEITSMKLFLPEYNRITAMHQGWFSFCVDATQGWISRSAPWTVGSWINSSVYSWTPNGASGSSSGVRTWDITSYRDWQFEDIVVNHTTYPDIYPFRVMWTLWSNTTHQYFDYVGIWYKYTNWSAFSGGQDIENIHQFFSINFDFLLWVLIIFLPTILINDTLPKVGFMGGLFIMLIVVGISEPTFIPFMVISMLALGVMIYKGE